MQNNNLIRSELTIIASDANLEGKVRIKSELHIYGKIAGEVIGDPGSTIILKEGSMVEGKIEADTLIIDGFVKGEISSKGKVWITSLGRVFGNLKTANLQVDPGAVFEVQVKM